MKSDIRERIDTAVDAANQPGPKTPEAKERVRWNSYQHGLTGQILRVSPDEQPFYDRIAEGFRARFAPADELEEQLVQKLIDDNWRLNSCAALENALFTQGDLAHGQVGGSADPAMRHLITRALTWQEQGSSFERLGRYETHIHRRFHRNLTTLEHAQSERFAREKSKQQQQTATLSQKIDLFRKMVRDFGTVPPPDVPTAPGSVETPHPQPAVAPENELVTSAGSGA